MQSPINYRLPDTREGGQAVNINRHDDGSVEITIHYPRKHKIELIIGAAVGAAIAIGLPLLMAFVADVWVGAAIGTMFTLPLCLVVRDYYHNAISTQEWFASPEGLTIIRHLPSGKTQRRFIPRARIRNVYLKSTGRSGTGCDIKVRARYFTLLSVGPTLYTLPAADIKSVVNAVREALGIDPPRTTPLD